MPHRDCVQGTLVLHNRTKLVLRTNGFMKCRNHSWCNALPIVKVQDRSHLRCSPRRHRRVRLSQSGQPLADTIIVAQTGYGYAKRQSISSSIDSAGTRQVGAQCSRARHIERRTHSGLYQKASFLDGFFGVELNEAALRGPCIPTPTL